MGKDFTVEKVGDLPGEVDSKNLMTDMESEEEEKLLYLKNWS